MRFCKQSPLASTSLDNASNVGSGSSIMVVQSFWLLWLAVATWLMVGGDGSKNVRS
jgi:hypothetical protein